MFRRFMAWLGGAASEPAPEQWCMGDDGAAKVGEPHINPNDGVKRLVLEMSDDESRITGWHAYGLSPYGRTTAAILAAVTMRQEEVNALAAAAAAKQEA